MDILPPGIARVIGAEKEVSTGEINGVSDSPSAESADEIQHKIEALRKETEKAESALRAKQIAAGKLAHPLNSLLDSIRLFDENTERGKQALEMQKQLAASSRERLDEHLCHPHEVQIHIHNSHAINGIRNADLCVAEITRWLKARESQLADLHTQTKACLADGRQHLAHLLPDNLKHLAA